MDQVACFKTIIRLYAYDFSYSWPLHHALSAMPSLSLWIVLLNCKPELNFPTFPSILPLTPSPFLRLLSGHSIKCWGRCLQSRSLVKPVTPREPQSLHLGMQPGSSAEPGGCTEPGGSAECREAASTAGSVQLEAEFAVASPLCLLVFFSQRSDYVGAF